MHFLQYKLSSDTQVEGTVCILVKASRTFTSFQQSLFQPFESAGTWPYATSSSTLHFHLQLRKPFLSHYTMSSVINVAPLGDIVIAMGKDEDQKLARVSRMLLCIASPVFEAMLGPSVSGTNSQGYRIAAVLSSQVQRRSYYL